MTGDTAVLDEVVPYLEGATLGPDEHESFFLPRVSDRSDTLYAHCIKGIERAFRFGVHGLPLMGTGDWNDGMNRVGVHGQGESVWLGWFLHRTLTDLMPLARGPRRPGLRHAMPARAEPAARRLGGARVGRGVVPARLLRRRDAAGLGRPAGVPDRLHRAELGGAVRRGHRRPGGLGHGRGRRPAGHETRGGRAPVHAARSTSPGRIPATSRPTRPESARTAGSTPTGRPGRSSRMPRWGARTRPVHCSRSSTRSTTPALRLGSTPTRVSRTSWPPTSTPWRRTSGGPAGRGTPGSSGWMYRAGLEAILGLRREGESLRRRAVPAAGLDHRAGAVSAR